MIGYQYLGYWIVMSGAGEDRSWYIHHEPNDRMPLNQVPLITAFAAEHYIEQQNRIKQEEFPQW